MKSNQSRAVRETITELVRITNKGLEKLGYNVYDFQVKLLPLFIKSAKLDPSLLVQVQNKDKKVIDKLLKQMNKSFKNGNAFLVNIDGKEWGYGRSLDSELDGILGQEFFKQNKIITNNSYLQWNIYRKSKI